MGGGGARSVRRAGGGKLTPIFLFLVFFAGKLRMSARVQKKRRENGVQ